MDAADIDTIEDILRSYDVDGLLDNAQFLDLVEELRNRESVMIADADTKPKVGNRVKITLDLNHVAWPVGTEGVIDAIWDNADNYPYLVRFSEGVTLNMNSNEFEVIK